MSPARTVASRVPEAHARKVAALFNSLLAQGEDALAPYRSEDYQAPCVCGDEQDKHTGPVHTGSCTNCGKARCDRYRKSMVHVSVHRAVMGQNARFKDVLRRQRQEDYAKTPRDERQPGEWIIRFSDVGGCGRQMAYRNGLAGPVAEISVPKYDGEALAGEVVERAVQRVNSREFNWRQYQREVRYYPAIPRPGRADEIDPYIGMVTEIKSGGDWKMEEAAVFGTLRENLMQVCLYALALEEEGMQVNFVRVHYIHRDDLDEDFERHTYPWDDERRAIARQALVELAGRQAQLDIAEETGVLPERDRLGPTTDELCRRCEFAEVCWNIPRAEETGRTPESLTLLGEPPAPGEDMSEHERWEAEIEHVAKEIVALRRQRDEIERRLKAKNQLIDHSIPTRRYGSARIDPGVGGRIAYAKWVPWLFEWAMREKGVDLSEAGDPPRGGPGKPIAKLVGQSTSKKAGARVQAKAARTARREAEAEGGEE